MAASANYWYSGNRKIPLSFIRTTTDENGQMMATFQVAGSGTEIRTNGTFYICYPQHWTAEQIHSLEQAHGLAPFVTQINLQGVRFYTNTDPVASIALANQIYEEGNVLCASPRWLKQIRKKATIAGSDPFFPEQWHLLNTGQNLGLAGADINVSPAWSYTLGERTVIAIIDDGFDIHHPDLAENSLSSAHFDFVTNQPGMIAGSHGTAVAGIASARNFNQIGGRGVAPHSSLLGVRIFDESGVLDDLTATQGLLYSAQRADILNNSWGPQDGSLHAFSSPSPIVKQAIETAVTTGRGGLGNIIVFSAGNGGASDDSNLDGYANLRQVIAVSATTNLGKFPVFSEAGSNILVNAPSGGGTLNILTTDRLGGMLGYNLASTANDLTNRDYTNSFSGTSASAPIVSGVAALMLSINPKLNWREVKQIIAATAARNDPNNPLWKKNSAGYWVNEQYGFGRINAANAVSLATNYHPIQPETHTNSAIRLVGTLIPDANLTGLLSQLYAHESIRIENIEVTVNIPDHSYWGDLSVYLTSPSGSKIRLVKSHFINNNARVLGYHNWTMTTPFFLGENSLGNWTLQVVDEIAPDTGTLASWSIVFYGTRLPSTFAQLPYACTGHSMLYPEIIKPAAMAQGVSVHGSSFSNSASGSTMEDYRVIFSISRHELMSATEGLSVAFLEGNQGSKWYMRTNNKWLPWNHSMRTLQGFPVSQSQNPVSIYAARLPSGRYTVTNAYKTIRNDIIYCQNPVKIIVN